MVDVSFNQRNYFELIIKKLNPIFLYLFILIYLLFIVVSLDTPVLPVKQWEEHKKLRELVEKIREKQSGTCTIILVMYIIKLYLTQQVQVRGYVEKSPK